MGLLFYWKRENYRREMADGLDYHLNQRNRLLHKIELGESVWAITITADRRYVLAAELIVKAKTHNPSDFVYGRYRVWGDPYRSRYFVPDDQPDLAPLIRTLWFEPRG